jgi:hypothetical protein
MKYQTTYFIKAFVFSLILVSISCVDQIEYNINSRINLVVVDGRLTTLDEEQIVRLFRSKADSVTGRFGSMPILGAKMELVVNGSQIVAFTENKAIPGNYILPEHYRGEVGNTYQIRFQLPEGTSYESEPEELKAVPSMQNLTVKFNPSEVAETGMTFKGFHEFFADVQDPANQKNFYSWEYNLYEKQDWCKSCLRGVYAVNNIIPNKYMFRLYYVSGDEPFEDCFTPQPKWDDPEAPQVSNSDWTYDYLCRTKCWEILHNTRMNLFDDTFTNGGQILHRSIAKIPFYQRSACLVEVRQLSMTKSAYDYYKLFQQQIDNNGGIADTPPTALRGNIKNTANSKEVVVGYFSVSDVSSTKYWLDRKDTGGAIPPGLFEALTARSPNPEPDPPYTGPRGSPMVLIWGGPPRVPTAFCIKSDSRTPSKPDGWRDEP